MNFDAAQNTAINNEHLGIGSVIELLILHSSDGSKTFYSSDDDTRPAQETANSNICASGLDRILICLRRGLILVQLHHPP
jgi:hypothetical protein